MKMKKINESVIMFLVFVCAVSATPIVLSKMIPDKNNTPPKEVAISRDEVISGYNFPADKYILIEFMDYACPPCKAQFKYVDNYLKIHNQVSFLPKHLPWNFHKNAKQAALLSLESMRHNYDLSIHDILMRKKELSVKEINRIASIHKLPTSSTESYK